MKTPELYVRAIDVALRRGLSAKGQVCRFVVGPYEIMFNGTREDVEGVAFGHLKVGRPGDFLPVLVVGPDGGVNAGAHPTMEDEVIALLKAEQDSPPDPDKET